MNNFFSISQKKKIQKETTKNHFNLLQDYSTYESAIEATDSQLVQIRTYT